MLRKVLSFIEQNQMIKQGEHIAAAVSGGADSVCLLFLLMSMKKELDLELSVVHVEHGIRGKESEQDARFVSELCEKMDIHCQIYTGKARAYAKEHGKSLEEGARELRYLFFAQYVREAGIDKIAVAHNQNDCAETMLFHLARGTGLKGMSGIAPVRGTIIRPLLCVTREEIESYLDNHGQTYCMDATNLLTEYSRNKIRHQVLPVLKEINKQAVPHIYQSTEFIREASELVETLVEDAMDLYVKESFIMEEIINEPSVVQRTLIHKVLATCAGSSKDITRLHVQKVQELFKKPTGKGIQLPYQMYAMRSDGGILIKEITATKKKAEENHTEYDIQPGRLIQVSEGELEFGIRILEKDDQIKEIPKKRYTKWFDYDKIKDTLQIRTRRQGDFFVLNRQGNRQKLKDYFMNEKIPADERSQIWLLVEGSHVLWIVGYRISEAYKITERTKRILEIQVDGGKIHE